MWKRLCIPYFKQLGDVLAKPGPSEDDRTFVRLMCRRILQATEHGNERAQNPMLALAGEIERGEV